MAAPKVACHNESTCETGLTGVGSNASALDSIIEPKGFILSLLVDGVSGYGEKQQWP